MKDGKLQRLVKPAKKRKPEVVDLGALASTPIDQLSRGSVRPKINRVYSGLQKSAASQKPAVQFGLAPNNADLGGSAEKP